MQLSCPFCGQRDESEFFYAAEAGKLRPSSARSADAQLWSSYLYFQNNPKGASREVWVHLLCGEFFQVTRDTVSNEVMAEANLA